MSREMPEGWRAGKFDTFITLQRGFDLPVQDRRQGTFAVIASNGQIDSHSEARIPGPAVVTGRSGTLGKVFFIPEGCWPLNTTLYVRDFHGNDPEFVTWFLKQFKLDRFGTGTGVPTLNRNVVHEVEVTFPPLHEQRRIAEILSSVDEAIAATRAVIEQTRKVKRGVLERLLAKGIGHTRFKQTEIGEIPEEWTVKSVDDLCVLSNGNGFRPPDWADSGLPIIRIQNLNGSQNFNYFNGTPLEKWLIHPGDLLFAWAGVRGVSFGPTIWGGPLGVLNQHIFKISCREQVDKSWLFHMMRLITARIEAKAHGFKDSLLHVHKKEITAQLVPVPSHAEQVQISARLAGVQAAEELAASSLQQLLATKSALMSDLLTGRKRVTDALPLAAE